MYGLIKLQDIIIIVNPPPPPPTPHPHPLGQYYHNRTFNEHAMILAPSMSSLCSTMKETQRRPSHRRKFLNDVVCGRRVNSTLQNTE